MSGLLFGREGGGIKKGGRQGSWMEPRFFFLEMGMGDIPTSHSPTPRLADWGHHLHLTLQHPTLPISPHIDEDALEGVYFAF